MNAGLLAMRSFAVLGRTTLLATLVGVKGTEADELRLLAVIGRRRAVGPGRNDEHLRRRTRPPHPAGVGRDF